MGSITEEGNFMKLFKLSLVGVLASLAFSQTSQATKVGGLDVVLLQTINSASAVEVIVTPKGNQKEGFGSADQDWYSIYLKDALIGVGRDQKLANVVLFNTATEATAAEIASFYRAILVTKELALVPSSWASLYQASSKSVQVVTVTPQELVSKPIVWPNNGAIQRAQVNDLFILQSGGGYYYRLKDVTGKPEDQATRVLISAGSYVDLQIRHSSEPIQFTKSVVTAVPNTEFRLYLGGLITQELPELKGKEPFADLEVPSSSRLKFRKNFEYQTDERGNSIPRYGREGG